MTLVDLFAGCGGGSLGLRDAGFQPIAAVELDETAAASYRRNIGLAPITQDIRRVLGTDLVPDRREPTLVFGCPPCQGYTTLRRGTPITATDRRRYQLISEYLRIVEELRPRHVAFENVPGMQEIRGTGIGSPRPVRTHPRLRRLIDRLEDLGYMTAYDVVDAADHGVPQHRRRLVVIASRVASPRLPEKTHAVDEGLLVSRWRTVRDAIEDLPPLWPGEISGSDHYHAARNHAAVVIERLSSLREGQARKDLPAQLRLKCHKDHTGHFDIYGRMWWDRPAPTLTSGCTNVTRGRFAHPEQPRAITIREAMRLQSFEDDAQLDGGHEAMALQIGNAVPPVLASAIGSAIAQMELESRGMENVA